MNQELLIAAVVKVLEADYLAQAKAATWDLVQATGYADQIAQTIGLREIQRRCGLPSAETSQETVSQGPPADSAPEPEPSPRPEPGPPASSPPSDRRDPPPPAIDVRWNGPCEKCLYHRSERLDDRLAFFCRNELSPRANMETGMAETCDHGVPRPTQKTQEGSVVSCPICGRVCRVQTVNADTGRYKLRPHKVKLGGHLCAANKEWFDPHETRRPEEE